MEDRRGVNKVFRGGTLGKEPLGRPRRRWDVIIKMDFLEVQCVGIDWVDVAQGRDMWRALVNAVINLRVP